MAKPTRPEKLIVGRTEPVDLPEFGLMGLAAKVDTGARTSSIHCKDVELVTRDGEQQIAFTLLDPDHPEYTGTRLYAHEFTTKVIRSSMGEEQERYVIESDIVVAGRTVRTEFTLADREAMNYPVLLGRRLLRGNFLVDVGISRASISVGADTD